MVYIYILQLEKGKYYVGKTTNPQFRLEQHFNSSGSQYTKKYTPQKVLEIIPNCDNFDEDKYTLKYMEQYGINNVRGGAFCKLKLDKDNLSTIKKMINGSSDKCYICGETGHFANNCKQDDDNILEEFFITKKKIKKNTCDICEREGHYAADCYAKTTITGYKLKKIEVFCCSYCNKEFDTVKAATCHEKLYCKNKTKKNTCDICGRESHTSTDCYAKTTIAGEKLEEIEVFCCSYCNKEFDTIKAATCHEKLYCKKKKKNTCNICGREGHTSTDCYAKTTIAGDKIEKIEVFCCSYCNKEFDTIKGVTCHENLYCKNKNKNKKTTKNTCDICGKKGHYSADCYEF